MAHKNRIRTPYTRETRKSHGDRKGILLIIVVLAIFIGLGLFFFKQKQQHRMLDVVTLCPKEPKETDSITVLIVDMTDEMTTVQKKDFQNQLESLRASTPHYDRLEIFAVDTTNTALLTPIVSLCNPGRGKDIDPLVGNPDRVEHKWQTAFQEPLDKAFAAVVTLAEAKSSPILESIQSVALTSFQQIDRTNRPHKLIVASDLIQFTEAINFYKTIPDPAIFLKSSTFQTVRTDLRGVDVELWMLRRPDQAKVQTRELILLWEALLSEQDARLTRVYNVSG